MRKAFQIAAVVSLCWLASIARADDALSAGFRNPPDSARPQTWWHWMNGNITKEGITADLEAMKRVGVGGAEIFPVDCDIPAGKVKFMSDEYREMIKHAVSEANRLGLEICLHNCAGWSSSGGPWNTPEHAMQFVVSTETKIKGPANFSDALKQPKTELGYYRDIAVLAFPAPESPAAIDGFRNKAGYDGDPVDGQIESTSAAGAIARDKIIDLTDKLSPDGKLTWDVPAGNWIVMRIGHTPTGVTNHPAPPEGTGPEVDKFSREALDAHWAGMMQKLLDDAGPLAGKSLNDSLIDSYETGDQNWTPLMRQEFQKRRGYDPLPFLPALSGKVIDNPQITERFLWDLRRTIADLFAENYYGYFAELCHKHGIKFSTEPYTGPFESLQCGKSADIVMGEFWTGGAAAETVKLASSIAHIYGKQLVGAESFTSAPGEHGRWQEDPYSLKALGDQMYCQGLNRFIFHRYAMQPWLDRLPGMTMGQWGFHFDRTNTWFEQSTAWLKYVARCQFILQQGRFVADAAYFCGEGAPVEMKVGNPPLPAGYDYDAINSDVLLNDASVKDGRIVLKSGMSYAVLILPPDDTRMSPEFVEKIRDLVRDGATVVGPKPTRSPSFRNYPQCDEQVRLMAERVWGDCDGKSVTEHAFGKGKVVFGKPMDEVLAAAKVGPDFEAASSSGRAKFVYIHRVIDNDDVYFVSNQRDSFASATCTFRVSGKVPQLWHPDSGVMEAAPAFSEKDGRISVPLQFDPSGSVFVVFQKSESNRDHLLDIATASEPAAPAPKIEIQHAVYEAIDGKGSMDVTNTMTNLLKKNDDEIAASNDTFGKDPAWDHVKQLRVDYTIDGKPQSLKVRENESIVLLPSTAGRTPPKFEIVSSLNGAPQLLAWENGSCDLTLAGGKTKHIDVSNVAAPMQVAGPWEVHFPPKLGAPASVTLDTLISWTKHSDPGVKYFSGSATYTKTITIPPEMLGADRSVWLDLGSVKNLAQVKLNGDDVGILWKPPFRVNLASHAKAGENKLEVTVTNLWPNRLIGDEQLPSDREWKGKQLVKWPQWFLDGKSSPTGRITFTTWHHWTKDDQPLESGLIGPVILQSVQRINLR